MKVRYRRKHPDVPLGTMQLCLPMQAEPIAAQVPEPAAGAGTAPLSERFGNVARSLVAAYWDLGLQVAYTPQHCAKLERLLKYIQAQVQECLALGDQRVITQLRVLHRSLVEATVVLRSVSGLCAIGRHMAEPSDTFWQLVECVRELRQDCQTIAGCAAPVSYMPTPAQASA